MKKAISKLISHKLIYGLTAGIIVAVAIFVVFKMIPKVSLSEQPIQNENLIEVAETQDEKTQVPSRGNDEARTQDSTSGEKTDNEEKDKAKKEENKKSNEKTEKSKSSNKDSKKSSKKDTTKYISIKEVKISRDMDLSKRTGLSRKDFIKLIAGVRYDTSGFFEDNAGTIYDLCEKYSINEIFFCGLISAESAWNIAQNHRSTHNYISLMKNGKLIRYGSVYEGLEVAAQKLHYNYLTPGGKFYHGKTLSGVQKCFCPSSTWVGLVYGRMQQII